jgi:hypothetical protein
VHVTPLRGRGGAHWLREARRRSTTRPAVARPRRHAAAPLLLVRRCGMLIHGELSGVAVDALTHLLPFSLPSIDSVYESGSRRLTPRGSWHVDQRATRRACHVFLFASIHVRRNIAGLKVVSSAALLMLGEHIMRGPAPQRRARACRAGRQDIARRRPRMCILRLRRGPLLNILLGADARSTRTRGATAGLPGLSSLDVTSVRPGSHSGAWPRRVLSLLVRPGSLVWTPGTALRRALRRAPVPRGRLGTIVICRSKVDIGNIVFGLVGKGGERWLCSADRLHDTSSGSFWQRMLIRSEEHGVASIMVDNVIRGDGRNMLITWSASLVGWVSTTVLGLVLPITTRRLVVVRVLAMGAVWRAIWAGPRRVLRPLLSIWLRATGHQCRRRLAIAPRAGSWALSVRLAREPCGTSRRRIGGATSI